MLTITSTATLTLIALTCICPQTAAQARHFRTLDVGLNRAVFVMSSAESTLRISDSKTGASTVLPNAVYIPGAVITINGTSGSRTHVTTGRDVTGNGIVQVIADNGAGTFSIAGVSTIVGADICGVTYSLVQQKLFVLDAVQERIMSAPYTLGAAAPTTWSTVVTTQEVPALADAANRNLHMLSDGAEPQLQISEYGPVVPARDWFTIKLGGTVEINGSAVGSNDFASLDDIGCVVGALSVDVLAQPSTVVSVVEISSGGNISLGSATTDLNGHATVLLSQPLDHSKVYAAQSALTSEPTEPFVVPLMRWGPTTAAGLNIDNGLRLRPWGNIGTSSYIGNDAFFFSLRSEPQSSTSQVTLGKRQCTLLLGIHGIHTTTNTEQGPLLQAGWFGNDTMEVIDQGGAAAIVDAPIPNDSGLEGVVLLAQWVIEDVDSPSVFLSDIVGVRLRGAEVFTPHQGPSVQTSANTASSSAAGLSGPPSATTMSRIKSWMKLSRFKKGSQGQVQKIKAKLDAR